MADPVVWQIAAGEEGRRYDDLFEAHDVMFLGPGDPGPYDPRVYDCALGAGTVTKNQRHRLGRFCEQVHAGDLVIARRGKRVVLLGMVHDAQTEHDDRFDDIHGWDLQHCRRVIWQSQHHAALDEMQKSELLFSHVKQIRTFTKADVCVVDKVRSLFGDIRDLPPRDLPPLQPKALSQEELAELLFARGVAYDSVHRVCNAIEKLRRLVGWYRHSHHDHARPTEQEVVAHIILPILLALGWSEQLLAVEWGRRDLAAFVATPTNHANCRLVVEAKEMSHGLQGVLQQAINYTKDLPRCQRILVTNGVQNYLYFKESDDWQPLPRHYFNLQRLRVNHVCYPGTNAVDGIVALTPASVARRASE